MLSYFHFSCMFLVFYKESRIDVTLCFLCQSLCFFVLQLECVVQELNIGHYNSFQALERALDNFSVGIYHTKASLSTYHFSSYFRRSRESPSSLWLKADLSHMRKKTDFYLGFFFSLQSYFLSQDTETNPMILVLGSKISHW